MKTITKLKFGLSFLAVVLASFSSPKLLMAQYTSQQTTINPLSIDKLVKPINDETIKDFMDNIDSARKIFVNDEILEYKLVVKNIGTSTITNIEVTDYLPKYLSMIFYPGTFDKNTNEIKFTIDNLEPNQSKNYIIRAKINKLPTTKFVGSKIKLTNRATARISGFSDTDTASIFGALTIIPATGTNDLIIKTVLVLTLAGTAFGT
jgi:uncharacterized repeat protein (TIGR01451 family)